MEEITEKNISVASVVLIHKDQRMKVGIIGLPQVGKKTLFKILTSGHGTDKNPDVKKAIIGTAAIKDPRFDTLVKMYNPRKQVRPKVDLALLPTMEKEAIAEGNVFREIADVDAVCHVVRAFKNESIYHVSGSVDPQRDIDSVNSELVLNDMIFIEKRLERIAKDIKKMQDKKLQQEKVLLEKLKVQLEKELPLRLLELIPEEKKLILSYPFITLKEMIVVLNISDADLQNEQAVQELKKNYAPLRVEVMQVSAEVEAEIAGLETEDEKKEFLQALDIAEPALDVFTRMCLKALGLMSFFTVGEDEVRQWLIHIGSSAPEAAGAIHSDLQKGFIRAEVMKYADLMEHKTEAHLKSAGKYYTKGKDYIVEDGDIINIRFNV